METQENDKLSPYLEALRKAKSDNERFAALLMVAKVTKDEQCDIDKKRQILDAVGKKFFSRLLKTENVPEDCSPDIHKSVALSILSALCGEPDIAQSSVFVDNLPSLNAILTRNISKEDGSSQQCVDDVYTCLNSISQSQQGVQALIEKNSVSVMCEVIINKVYGHEKAQDILFCLLSSAGPQAWSRCEMMFNTLFLHFSKQFKEEKGEKKFEICKTLVFLLTTVPPEVENQDKPPWVEDVVAGLDSILRSKIGTSQREPALRLASMLVQVCGVDSILPPVTDDCKLLLLTTHLCCVEVRMVLEATDIKQAFKSGHLLSSCYSYLECIINYLTVGPTLSLDERQIIQLHSAMMGAFGAVTHFLKKTSDDPDIQWNSIVLATIRILAAWMAEETTALKDEVYELIPFLIQVSKLCIPANNELSSLENGENLGQEDADKESPLSDKSETLIENDNGTQNSSKLAETDASEASNSSKMTKCDQMAECDSVINKEDNTKSSNSGEGEEIIDSITNREQESNLISEDIENLQLNDKDNIDSESNSVDNKSEKNGGHIVSSSNLNSSEKQNDDCNANEINSRKSKHVTFEPSNVSNKNNEKLNNNEEKVMEINEHNDSSKSDFENQKSKYQKDSDLKILQTMMADNKEFLTEKELHDLHVRVNIFHFLLPGMCHMTADDEPRRILLNCGALSLLDLYMWRQWEKFWRNPDSREVQSSLVILCNIFLNLTIVEPDVVSKYEEFSHILLLTVKGISVVEQNHLVLWSHLVTLGLMLMRLLHKKTEQFLESESITTFFHSCVKYMNNAYTVRYKKKGQAVMELDESYTPVWDQISQTWFLSMQAFSACIPLFPEAPIVVLQSGWLPSVLKNFLEVRGNGMAEEVRSCYLLLWITIAKESETAKTVIKEKKGIEISKMYKFKELLDLLQTSPKIKELKS